MRQLAATKVVADLNVIDISLVALIAACVIEAGLSFSFGSFRPQKTTHYIDTFDHRSTLNFILISVTMLSL